MFFIIRAGIIPTKPLPTVGASAIEFSVIFTNKIIINLVIKTLEKVGFLLKRRVPYMMPAIPVFRVYVNKKPPVGLII